MENDVNKELSLLLPSLDLITNYLGTLKYHAVKLGQIPDHEELVAIYIELFNEGALDNIEKVVTITSQTLDTILADRLNQQASNRGVDAD